MKRVRRIRLSAIVQLAVATAMVLGSGRSGAQSGGPPPASTGFQLDMTTGATLPVGKATGAPGDNLGARYSMQVPMLLGLGGKPDPRLYLGGFMGLGLGWEGGDNKVEAACDDRDPDLNNDIACGAYSYRVGIEARYSFAPDARWNPWMGYGFGLTGATQTIHDQTRGRRESTSVRGWELARLSFGLDARLGRVVGLGPVMILDVGRFDHTSTRVGSDTTFDGPVDDRTVHAWVTVGARVVLFP